MTKARAFGFSPILVFLVFLWLQLLPLRAFADETALSPPPPAVESAEQTETDEEEAAEEGPTLAPVNEAWNSIWSGQREMVTEIRETALKLGENFSRQTENLAQQMQPFEEEGRRLLVFVQTFSGYPNAMEAVNRRIAYTIKNLENVLEPVTLSRAEAQGLLERINYLSASLPDDTDKERLSPEMRAYVDDIVKARLRLTAVLAQYDSVTPSLSLLGKLEQTRTDIDKQLPELWKNYYFQRPVAWINPDSWINAARDIGYAWKAMMLRLPVEIPTTASQLGTAAARFFIGLFFVGALLLGFRKRWLTIDSSPASRHMFNVSLPWLAFGFAVMGGALSASGDFFRTFLAAGSFCMILGQIYLAWDLRCIQKTDKPYRRSPFLRLLPLVICAYLLLYLPLTQPVCLAIWTIVLVAAIYRHRKWRLPDLGGMHLETGVRECYVIILWLCLFLAVSGLNILSVVLYLAYVALAVALELSFGGIAIVNSINERLPQEGAKAVVARLLVALAAPFVLVLAVIGVCLWVAVLPGGTYLLGEYALKGVTVGATQFNVIQALLIISVFYLTRTAVAMGTRFLAKLPRQGLHFDPTLITPLQTAFTYAAWAVFGLFAMRSLGVELSSLAMIAGGLSVGIGFGMQNIVNNFISGLILIFGRTLQVGDIVEVGGAIGRVRKISVRATMVETYDNAIIYVPNSEFMAGRLTNWTSFSRSVRREVQVGVAYGSDTQKVIKLLLDVAAANENVLKYPAPSVNFADFGASALDFRLRFWVKDYDLGAAAASSIRLEINKAFAAENIEISFPQLDVHLKSEQTAPKTPEPRKKIIAVRASRPPKPARPALKRPVPKAPANGSA